MNHGQNSLYGDCIGIIEDPCEYVRSFDHGSRVARVFNDKHGPSRQQGWKSRLLWVLERSEGRAPVDNAKASGAVAQLVTFHSSWQVACPAKCKAPAVARLLAGRSQRGEGRAAGGKGPPGETSQTFFLVFCWIFHRFHTEIVIMRSLCSWLGYDSCCPTAPLM